MVSKALFSNNTNNDKVTQVMAIESHPQDSRVGICKDGINQPLSANMCHDPSNGGLVMVYENHSQDSRYKELADVSETVSAKYGTGGNNQPLVVKEEKDMDTVVRRLTPMECERLQAFPDGWTDIGDWIDSKGKKHKGDADSPRYKALGNSIALPFWQWMAERMIKVLADDGVDNPTMASLFDGIGGFPLAYQRVGCKPVWASEIEEFPIAVTKLRLGEGEDGI